MPIEKITLPQYSLAQEIWNAISHGLGTLLTLIFGPFLIIKAVNTGSAWAIVGCSIYVFSLLLCFTSSCLYHALARNNGKRVFRVLDHAMVYALIMGTYAPYCLVSLNNYHPGWCWAIWGSVIAGGAFAITMSSINIVKYKKLNFIAYMLMGWAVAISLYPLSVSMGGFFPGPFLLLMGGVVYSLGALLYCIGKKHSAWWHTVFHFFVLGGAILMFISIYFYVL